MLARVASEGARQLLSAWQERRQRWIGSPDSQFHFTFRMCPHRVIGRTGKGAGIEYITSKYQFSGNSRALTMGDAEGHGEGGLPQKTNPGC